MNYLSQKSQKPELDGSGVYSSSKPSPTPSLMNKPVLIQNTHYPTPCHPPQKSCLDIVDLTLCSPCNGT